MIAKQSKPIAWVCALFCLCWTMSVGQLGCEPGPTNETPGADASTADKVGAEPGQESAPPDRPLPRDDTQAEPIVEPPTPDRSTSPPERRTPELANEASPEPTPEPAPEPTPERSAPDGPVVAGPCKEKQPKCAAGYVCRDDVKPAQCHRQCNPAQRGGCPSGHLCQVLSSGEGICVQGTEAKKGEKCNAQTICGFGLICVLSAAGSTAGTCYQRCTLDTLSGCPSSEYCFLVHSRNGVCLPGPAGSKPEGADCKRSNECTPGMVCFTPLNQKSRCAKLCDKAHSCTAPLRCRALKDAPADAGACIQ